MKRPDVRIEFPSRGTTYNEPEHAVYEYGRYPRHSVLAGQQMRMFRESGTLEECQKYCQEHYGFVPEVNGCGYQAPYLNHLPDDGDY